MDISKVKHSPRSKGFVGHRPLSSRKKETEDKPRHRPYNVNYSSNKKKPFQKQRPQAKGLVIKGEEIKPVVIKHDGRRKVSELYEEDKTKKDKEREKLEQKKRELENKERENYINQKVSNLYKIDKSEEEKVLNDNNHKPPNFVEKPLSKQLGWMKPSSDNMENSKENNPFGEESKREVKAVHHVKEKFNKYRKSILDMLDNEEEIQNENDGLDGLETNREISDEEEREDDNILDGTNKSIKLNQSSEVEQDLDLDTSSENEPIPIEGKPYFISSALSQIDPMQTVLKHIIIDKFGVEKTEKGIEYWKKLGTSMYLEDEIDNQIQAFKRDWFDDTHESILEFISTVSSLLSYW